MSRFDRFGRSDGQNLPALGRASTAIEATGEGARRLIEAARKQTHSSAADQIRQGKARVAIALDGTGSMAHLISAAKESIAEIIRRASKEAGRPLEIQLFVYRDYDVPQEHLEKSPMSKDPDELVRWLGRIEAFGGGGNCGEAVEAALQAIQNDGKFDVVLMAGDEPSNSRQHLNSVGKPQTLTALELAAAFGVAKKPVHAFVVGQDPRTVRDFAAIAKATGGKSGRLDGSREMIDLAVMAILSALKGSAAVRAYMDRQKLSSNAVEYGNLLLGHSK